MTLRFVPRFRRQFHTVAQAQRFMGRDTENGSPLQRARNAMKVFFHHGHLEPGERHRHGGQHAQPRLRPAPAAPPSPSTVWTAATRSLLLWLAFCGTYLLAAALSRGLFFQYYPMLGGAPLRPITVSFYAVYLLLCLTPGTAVVGLTAPFPSS